MRTLIRALFSVIGVALGVAVIAILQNLALLKALSPGYVVAIYIFSGIIGFILFYLIAPSIFRGMRKLMDATSRRMETVPLDQVIIGTTGLIVGLLIAGIISNPILQLSIIHLGNAIGVILAVLIYIFLGSMGWRLALSYREEILGTFHQLKDAIVKNGSERRKETESHAEKAESRAFKRKLRKYADAGEDLDIESIPKILDTSALIDGRIFEVIRIGFLDGPFIISHYVLEELQHIADSSDVLRRERGRKGLDRIHELQTQFGSQVIIESSMVRDAQEVDLKLLLLTKKYRGAMVTTDYNLNKVASVQNLRVLNVNDLANALKPPVIPGEHLMIKIIKAGKEPRQGLGYLEDGTMIVVENGENSIGKNMDTVVTSVLQTSAGKMIFTRIPG